MFPLKRVKGTRLDKRNVSGRVTLLPGTELRLVSFNKRRQNEEAFSRLKIHGARMFPIRETFYSVSFCFQDANYACATQQGTLTKIGAYEHLQNFFEHEQASTHLIFASNSSKGQILRALSNWMGPFDTPYSAAQIYPNYAYAYYTLAFCVYAYRHTRIRKMRAYIAYVLRVYAHVNTRVYVPLLCIPISFFICILLKRHADQWKLSHFKFSITWQIHQPFLWLLLDLKLPIWEENWNSRFKSLS